MVALLFGAIAAGLILTVPIAVTLALSSALALIVFYPGSPLFSMLSQNMVITADSFSLMAIPFFMLCGELMGKTDIANRLVRVGEAVIGSVAGGLGMAAIVACVLFAAISGSGPATVAAIGAIMIPAMSKRGYSADYTAALVAGGSTIGPVIPPSIPMIVYGATVGVSVIGMFTAGIVPGIIMGVALMFYNYFVSKKRGYLGMPREGGFLWVLKQCWDAKWALLMPIIVLGGIYGGFFTPTESAVVGCVYAILVGLFVTKDLNWKVFTECLEEAAILSAIVMIVLGGANTFGRLLTIERIPEMITAWMLGVTQSPLGIMLICMGILLIGGMFMDTISNIVLLAPLLVPIIKNVGWDPMFFGVVMTINLCIGFLTPPLGVNLFVAQGIAGVSFEAIVKQVVPIIIVLCLVLLLFILVPEIVMFLPRLLGMA
ncbi:MAG TPA: TRAP transporter large permease [Clostridia bacterium]|nr:TRAP transporter large permease [Clostridia bacterium]